METVEWMLENGFKKEICMERKKQVLAYKGYSWETTEAQITPLEIVKKYKDWYDGAITESELDNFLDNHEFYL